MTMPSQVRIVEVLGNPKDQRKISLIAVHAHGIPDEFPAPVLAEVQKLEPPRLEGRADLRSLPLLTIDPVDARDHDDAVHAAPDSDPQNGGGFIVKCEALAVERFDQAARQGARQRDDALTVERAHDRRDVIILRHLSSRSGLARDYHARLAMRAAFGLGAARCASFPTTRLRSIPGCGRR